MGIVEVIAGMAVIVGVSLTVTLFFAYALRALIVVLLDQPIGALRQAINLLVNAAFKRDLQWRPRPKLGESWDSFSFM